MIHFPAGAIAVGSGGQELLQASINMPQSRLRERLGAGDAFAAGVLLGLHEDVPMDAALTYGVCAAAASLTDPTSSDGVEPLAECLTVCRRNSATAEFEV